MFAMDEGFNIISMAVLGGMGTLVGPIAGAFIVNFITEFFRFVSEYRLVVYALLIIIMMWVRPQGLLGASDSVLAYVKADKEARKIRKAGGI
jgi:branched-chain amino acid transport system permease protein